MLAYASVPGETERNALIGTPDEIHPRLQALNKAGADYVLLTILGGREQLHAFARAKTWYWSCSTTTILSPYANWE